MITANVGIWGNSCVCFADAGLEALGCQDEVYLVVNLPIRVMLGCCSRQRVRVQSVFKGESVAFCELKQSASSVVCLSNAKSSHCHCLLLVSVKAYFSIPVVLTHKYRKVNRVVRKRIKATKKYWIEEQCENIEKGSHVKKQQ